MKREHGKELLRNIFASLTRYADPDYRNGLRLVPKAALRHRWHMAVIFFGNVMAAVFEGGTIAILAVAVTALVEQKSAADLTGLLGDLGWIIATPLSAVGPGGLFLILVLLAVVAQLIKSAMTYVSKYVTLSLQFKISREMQEWATNQVMDYSLAEITKSPAGLLTALIVQTSQVPGIVGTVNRGLLGVTMFTVYMVMMFAFSLPLAVSALIIVLLISFGISRMIRVIRDLGVRAVGSTLETAKISIELLQAPRLLRVFGAINFAKEAINGSRLKLLQAQEQSAKIRAILDPVIDALTIFTAGTFLVVGYWVSGEGTLEVLPKLLLYLLILNRMMPQAKTLNEVRLALASARYGLVVTGRFLRSCDKEFARTSGVRFDRFDNNIYFQDVSFCYPESDIEVISNLSFQIPKGQTVALVGPSGGGKSTITSLLLGLYEPSSGCIFIDGNNLNDISLDDWRAQIGVVDQDIFLLNASVAENIAFASEHCSSDEIKHVAELAYAHDFIMDLPDGYATVIGDRGLRLSGGQQQRLGLARALLRKPSILILDEATSALDSESERLIQRTIDELYSETTILIIAHRLSTVANADKIIVVDGGRLVEQGNLDQLLSYNGVFSAFWKLQVATERKSKNVAETSAGPI